MDHIIVCFCVVKSILLTTHINKSKLNSQMQKTSYNSFRNFGYRLGVSKEDIYSTNSDSPWKRTVLRPKNTKLVLIGNPGVGKSTLLNSLLGRVEFKAGVSLGTGLTEILQEVINDNGDSLIDTPGLSDVFRRQQAAQEIKKALTKGGQFKIIFAITLEAGRIRPDDMTTIKLVLQAAPMIQHSYSIIVNKASDEILAIWEDFDSREKFKALINQGLPGTDSIAFNPFDKGLDCKKNALPVLSAELQEFILNTPSLIIPEKDVKDIQINEFEAIQNAMAKKIQEFEDQNRLLLQQLERKDKDLQKTIDSFNKKERELRDKVFSFENERKQSRLEEIKMQKKLDSLTSKFEELKAEKSAFKAEKAVLKAEKPAIKEKILCSSTKGIYPITTMAVGDFQISFKGEFTYELTSSSVRCRYEKISNTRKNSVHSGTLHLRVCAAIDCDWNKSIKCYVLANHRLGELEGGWAYTDGSKTLKLSQPPPKTYHVFLVIYEWSEGIVDYKDLGSLRFE